jgi:hypothetical protein
MGGVCVACRKEKRNAYNVLMKIPEGKSPVGKPSHMLTNNIKIICHRKGLR